MVRADNTTASGNARAEGTNTTASGTNSHCEGYGTGAYGNASHCQGFQSSAYGTSSHAGGYQSMADGDYSFVQGYYARARQRGQFTRSAGNFSSTGDAQASNFVLLTQTTDATPKPMSFDKSVPSAGSSLPATNGIELLLPYSAAFRYRIALVMRRTDVEGDAGAWTFEGLTVRNATGPTTLVTTSVNGAAHNAAGGGGTGYAAAVSVVITGATEYLACTVTGLAGATARWVANMDVVEVW